MENLVIAMDFWRGKKVLITGHTGFKGSWLSLWLKKNGAEVVGYSLAPPTSPSLFHIGGIEKKMHSVEGDIRDIKSLSRIINEYRPEIVFHMAAQPLVRLSYSDPVETYNTNIMGTVNVLEAVRQSDSVKVLVNITSDKCYENQEWYWGYREIDPMGGFDPYSSSKGCAELVTAAYRRSFFSSENNGEHPVPVVATVRAGNVIGGGDWAMDRLVPDIMGAILTGDAPLIRYPNAIRPWQHVLEPLNGYLMLAQKMWSEGDKYAGAWNFGPSDDDARPVSWIADQLTKQWGGGAMWLNDNQAHPHEAKYLKLDCSKAKGVLQWKPKMELSTTLQWIVEWYKAYNGGKDMGDFTVGQIDCYEKITK